MEDKLIKLNTLKAITLNDEERGIIRAHLVRAMIEPPQLVTQSLFQRGVTHGLRIALSSMLFVVFVGGSVSAVANNALPGDPLYSFKINVNEEVKGLFLKTPEERVVWQKNRIENRVSEIKTLAASKTLTKAKQATVQKALDQHVAELSANLMTLSDESPNTALNVTASLEQSLKGSKEAIAGSGQTDSTEQATNTVEALKSVDDTLAKVSKQEETIISKEIDKIITDVSIETPPLATEDTTEPTPTTTPPEPVTPVAP